MNRFIYDLILTLFSILSLPYFIYKMIFKGKYRENFLYKFGKIDKELVSKFEGREFIWIHAVSVGETVASKPLINELKKIDKNVKILFSTVTETGNRFAKELFGESIDGFVYMPVDHSFLMKRFIKKFRARKLIIVETEIWPNLIFEAKKFGVEIYYVNARLNEKSYKGLRKIRKFIIEKTLKNIDEIYCQTLEDRERLVDLGANEESIVVSGNVKFDVEKENITYFDWKEKFNFKNSDKVIVAGSTHSGEEEIILENFKKLREKITNLKLIIAPRDIKRVEEVEKLVLKYGFDSKFRSEISNHNSGEVIIVDTIGELASIYEAASVVILGGSFVDIGGHNVLEPLQKGKYVVVGEYIGNYKSVMKQVVEREIGYIVKDESLFCDDLESVINLGGEFFREKIEQFLDENRGTSKEVACDIMKERGKK